MMPRMKYFLISHRGLGCCNKKNCCDEDALIERWYKRFWLARQRKRNSLKSKQMKNPMSFKWTDYNAIKMWKARKHGSILSYQNKYTWKSIKSNNNKIVKSFLIFFDSFTCQVRYWDMNLCSFQFIFERKYHIKYHNREGKNEHTSMISYGYAKFQHIW